MADLNATVRETLLEFLRGGLAHATLDDAVHEMPTALIGKRAAGAPHSAWQLVEHIRLTLLDLVDFCTRPDYSAPEWPKGYWPATATPKSHDAWRDSVRGAKHELHRFEALLSDPAINLSATIAWGDGQTVLREALLAIDHTSYHVGQLILLRKQLNAWKSA